MFTPTPGSPFQVPTMAQLAASPPAAKPRPGRPRSLTDVKIHQILNLVARGCSLDQAASHVGCATSTIRREARRNPEFNAELRRMLLDAELCALNAVRHASRKSWRAGRYLLERIDAQRAKRQSLHLLSPGQLRRFTSAITAVLESELTDPNQRHRITQQLKEALQTTNRNRTAKPSRRSTNSPPC